MDWRTTIGMMKKKSNKPTKTKKAMKTMKNFLSMAALALVGAMTVSCSSDDNIIDQPQQQEVTKNNVVTLTTTVGLGGDDATRALTSTGVKTFAEGEKMALRYKNKKGDWVKAESNALEAKDIADGSKSATFTFTLDNPDKTQNVDYIYPAAIVNQSGNMNEAALFGSQDGTLNTIASTFDYSRKIGAWDGDNLPSLTLENQLAILAITLKNADGSSDITSSITGLTLSDGTKTYNVTPSAAEGPIYVAIFPTEDATITVTATDGTKNYTKTLTGKTYAKGNGYSVSWKMAPAATDLSTITENYEAKNGETLTGTLASNVKISIADGATVTLKNVNITNLGNNCNWAGINCPGDATLVLEGTNEVCAGRGEYGLIYYPGIWIAPNKTLTIQGAGNLTANSNITYLYGAGIGGGFSISCGNIVINSGNITATGGLDAAGIGAGGSTGSCGNITINGGTITATSDGNGAGIGGGYGNACGNITISGGTVSATGGDSAAGIGGGRRNGDCGTITIKSTVTSVTATKGSNAPNSIGSGGENGTAITVTIEDGANVTQN